MSTVHSLRSRDIAVTLPNVAGALRDAGKYDAIGGDEFLAELWEQVYHARDVTRYAQTIREKARLRRRDLTVGKLASLTRAALPDEDRIAELVRVLTDGRDVGPDRFHWMTAAELAATDHEIPWLVEDLLVTDQPAIIGGAQKTLKTLLSVDLLVSLATGSRFLGTFRPVEAVACGLMSGESGASNLADAVRRIALAKGILPARIDRLHVSTDLPSLADDADLAAVERFVRERGLRVLALDCAYLMLGDLGDSAANLFVVGRFLRKLTDLMNRTGCLVVLLHHFGKRATTPGEPPELADLQFGGFAQWSGQHILLSRRSRFDPETGRHELWLSFGGRSGQSGLFALDVEEGRLDSPGGRYWSHTLTAASQARTEEAESRAAEREDRKKREREERDDRDRERILKVLAKHAGGATAKRIGESTGMSNGRVSALLESLATDGCVQTCDVFSPPRKTPFVGYRLTIGTTGTKGICPDGPGGGDGRGTKPPCKGGLVPVPMVPSPSDAESPDGPDGPALFDPKDLASADPRDVPGGAYL